MEKQHDLAKWLAGEMNETELREFEASEDFAAYDRIAKASARLKAPNFNEDEMLYKVYASDKKVVPINRGISWTRIASIVAILVLALGIFFWTDRLQMVTEIASAGQTKNLSLPDASQVVLNSGSEIEYNKKGWKGQREVHLKGEAFFHVAKGQRFDVVTDAGKVSVLGTQFNVSEKEDGFGVQCFEGRVRVASAGKEIILTKGMSVAFTDGKISENPVVISQPSWINGTLEFQSVALDEILESLEKTYGVTIENRSGKTSAFTGSLPADNLENAIEILCKTYNLKAENVQNKMVLSVNE